MTSLTVNNGSTLSVAAGATANLYVQGNVSVTNTSTLGAAPGSGATLLVVTGADATKNGQVQVNNTGDAVLSLYAPLADLDLNNHSTIYGAAFGRNVTLNNGQTVVFEPGPQAIPPPLTCQ